MLTSLSSLTHLGDSEGQNPMRQNPEEDNKTRKVVLCNDTGCLRGDISIRQLDLLLSVSLNKR